MHVLNKTNDKMPVRKIATKGGGKKIETDCRFNIKENNHL